ncbi:hypothetical protein CRU92_04065 [Arcobacter sp. FW59]|nr:hypothetical protein CRU92_04065 [Arcobacter sp. FW59]
MNSIKDKKAFTLIELIIVILILLLIYSLVFSNKSFIVNEDKENLTILNLREFLINNFDFKEDIKFSCIEDNFSCFIKIDNRLKEDFKIENFFTIKPNIYEYNNYKKDIYFKDLRIDNFDYKVIFELRIDNDYKINEFILDNLNGEIYLFNSIFKDPVIYKSFDDILDNFDKNQKEVKDAF